MKFHLNLEQGAAKKKSFLAMLEQVKKEQPEVIMRTLYEFGNVVMGRSKALYTPVAPGGGELRNSGQVHEPEKIGKTFSVTLSYGSGPSRAYAEAVHEHLSEHSPPSWVAAEESGRGINWTVPGTGPKYLEKPLNEARSEAAGWIARRIYFRGLNAQVAVK